MDGKDSAVWPFWLWRCGQNPLVIRNAPERVQSPVVITTAQLGALPWCLNLADGPGGQSPARFYKEITGPEISEDEFHRSLPTTLSRARAGVRL